MSDVCVCVCLQQAVECETFVIGVQRVYLSEEFCSIFCFSNNAKLCIAGGWREGERQERVRKRKRKLGGYRWTSTSRDIIAPYIKLE